MKIKLKKYPFNSIQISYRMRYETDLFLLITYEIEMIDTSYTDFKRVLNLIKDSMGQKVKQAWGHENKTRRKRI